MCVCVCVYIYTYSALVYSIYRQKQMNYREERDYLKNINMNQNVFYILFQNTCVTSSYAYSNIYWHMN